jgi:uncharacterized membrane protein
MPAGTEKVYPSSDARDSETETDMLGTWFARLGAIALLVGAGFGFKYAVDEGILAPALRVLLGVVTGICLIAWGEWSQRRDWPRLAQAVSGGGVALLYLSIWAAFQLYELVTGAEAFAALTVIAFVGGYLAVRYESMALAVLSTLGGFGNAILIGEGFERPAALFGYIVILDCVVLGLAYLRGWRVLDQVAFIATWLYFGSAAVYATSGGGLSGPEPQIAVAFTFATLYFVLFMSLTIARRIARQDDLPGSDLGLMIANGGLYILAAMWLLSEEGSIAWATTDQLRGPVLLAVAGVHLVAGLVLRRRKADDPLAGAALGSAVMLTAVWAPVQLDPIAVPAAWALMGAAMVYLADQTTLTTARFPGCVLLALSLMYLVNLFSDPASYEPGRLLLSPESASFVTSITALYASAYLLRRSKGDWEHGLCVGSAVTASLMTMWWLSLEATTSFRPLTDTRAVESLHFTLTGIWGLYATALLAVGISARLAGARYLALTIFGITALKLLLHDVWLLDTLYRTLVFMGFGVIFLTCSVMYHRFRDVVLGDRAEAAS